MATLASDKEAATEFREETALNLEILKDLQSSRVPEFLKVARNFQTALGVVREASMRLQLAWDHLANGVGADNNFGSRIKEMSKQFKEITDIDLEWDDGWERRFIQPVNMALIANEGKRTTQKEAEIRKVASRLEKEVKTAESVAKKKLKDKKVLDKQGAAEEYSKVLESVESRRKLVVADLHAHCEQSHFILLQAFCFTMKEKMEIYDRMHAKSKELMTYIGESQKVQPDMASAPSNEIMRDIYDEKRAAASQTLRKPSASDQGPPSPKPSDTRSSGSSYSVPAAPAPQIKKPSSYGLMKVQATWAFSADREGELSMQPGDILTIHDNTGAWWKAELNGQRGNIPANYVIPYEEPEDSSPPLPPPQLDDLPPADIDLPPPVDTHEPPPALAPPVMPAGGRGRGSGVGGASGPSTASGMGIPTAGRGIGRGAPDPAAGRGRGSVPAINVAAGRGRGSDSLVSPGGRGAVAPLSGGRGGIGGSSVDVRSAGGRGAGAGAGGFNGAASSGGRGAGVGGSARVPAGRGRGMPEALEPPPTLDLPPPIMDDAPAPLPRDEPPPPAAEWQQFTTPEGNVYYYNAATGESKWTMD